MPPTFLSCVHGLPVAHDGHHCTLPTGAMVSAELGGIELPKALAESVHGSHVHHLAGVLAALALLLQHKWQVINQLQVMQAACCGPLQWLKPLLRSNLVCSSVQHCCASMLDAQKGTPNTLRGLCCAGAAPAGWKATMLRSALDIVKKQRQLAKV